MKGRLKEELTKEEREKKKRVDRLEFSVDRLSFLKGFQQKKQAEEKEETKARIKIKGKAQVLAQIQAKAPDLPNRMQQFYVADTEPPRYDVKLVNRFLNALTSRKVPEERWGYALLNVRNIPNINKMVNVLKLLLPDEILSYLVLADYQPKHSDELIKLLKVLPLDCRYTFAKDNEAFIVNASILINVMELLPEHEALAFFDDFPRRYEVKTADELIKFLKILPLEDRYELAKHTKGLIYNAGVLIQVMQLLGEENGVHFLNKYPHKIERFDDLFHFLSKVPNNYLSHVAKQYTKSVENFSYLYYGLLHADGNRRFDIAKCFLHRIHTPVELRSILTTFVEEEEKVKFEAVWIRYQDDIARKAQSGPDTFFEIDIAEAEESQEHSLSPGR